MDAININSPNDDYFDESCCVGACFSESQNFPPRTRQVIKLAGKIALHALSCLKQILKHDLVPGLPYIQLLPLFLCPTHPAALYLSKR